MKKTIGYILFVLSFVAWLIIPILPFLDISKTQIAGITTILLVSAEVLFFASIALLGKEFWQNIKKLFKSNK